MFKNIITILALTGIAATSNAAAPQTHSVDEKHKILADIFKAEPIKGYDAAANECIASKLSNEMSDQQFNTLMSMREKKVHHEKQTLSPETSSAALQHSTAVITCGKKLTNPNAEAKQTIASYEFQATLLKARLESERTAKPSK